MSSCRKSETISENPDQVSALRIKAISALNDAGPRNIYVSANFGDDATSDPFSPSTPFKTIQAAANITIPGDVINIMNGTYKQPNNTNSGDIILKVNRYGNPAGYITYQPYPNSSPDNRIQGKQMERDINQCLLYPCKGFGNYMGTIRLYPWRMAKL